ncbi:type II toxin-antitoxin system RelE/ParE family toxin [Candidatus Woesearchaeota archaeon]|nr:type II toxin-antitoxin system RelE/ParE family toxin [Candidatus Woesearchaeota archaeon]
MRHRILNKVDESEADPLRFAERLVDGEGYKLRVGDYRIFVSISFTPDKIKIMAIRHRRNAYQRIPF